MTWGRVMWQRDRLECVLAAASLVFLGGCTGQGDRAQPATRPAGLPSGGCTGAVTRAPLPTWARAGFSPPGQTTTYVQGVGGDIVGVLFGHQLRSPQPRGQQNKILWVSRIGSGGPLRIAASLVDSDIAVVRYVQGGPGPSIVDLPAAGCWRFDLTWSGHSDQLYVPYQTG
jgi:hypothetical protein